MVGVLTALAAEQGVEWLHWRHEAQAARAALAFDFKRVVFWSSRRVTATPCIANRLDELTRIVAGAAEAKRLPPVGVFGTPPIDPWDLRSWDSLASSQVLAHLPRGDMLAVSAIQIYLVSMQTSVAQERRDWSILESLSGPPRAFGETEEVEMRGLLSASASTARNVGNGARNIRNLIQATHMLTDAEMADAEKTGAAEAAKASGLPAARCGPRGGRGAARRPQGEPCPTRWENRAVQLPLWRRGRRAAIRAGQARSASWPRCSGSAGCSSRRRIRRPCRTGTPGCWASMSPSGGGVVWREPTGSPANWSVFKADSDYFAPSAAPFMINLIVDDLDGVMLAKAKAEGAELVGEPTNDEYGRFGWLMDPAGLKIELWQPPETTSA